MKATMPKKLIFGIVLFCVLTGNSVNSVSTVNLTAARSEIDNLQTTKNETGKAYSDCECLNGYCELNDHYDYVCKCLDEYGLISHNECKRCNCGKGHSCTFQRDWFSLNKTCLCSRGYTERHGTCILRCSPDNCNYRGQCYYENEFVSCICDDPYYGDTCDEVICDNEYCNYRGTCSYELNELKCTCTSVYFGDRCEKALCEPNPCENEGFCFPFGSEGKVKCHCTSGYTGDYCKVKTQDYTFIMALGGTVITIILFSCLGCLVYRRYRRKDNTTVTISQPEIVISPVHQIQDLPQSSSAPPPYFEHKLETFPKLDSTLDKD